ncbi:mitogen activated protein kinase [Aspergillus ruber CBS 135680]|uniref:mitogen-activated protein kinase n=1 Tax=Aspergillus ruber (strain CBS 135680) TaxID=1388766 RepID=A0A017S6R9_ASPRC|nr:mitogen activated protein kinase [Aspergillus ruber CBS 135680]EYE91865.1 mitogen activated protein kinase [Aspergillus ruber CBS 135680]
MGEFVRTEVLGTTYEITERYSDLQPRGFGASGVICCAHDSLSNLPVVLKKIANPFDNVAVIKRTLREVHLLNKLRHDNLINMNDIFISPSEDLYLVTDFMMTDLYQVIRTTTLDGQFVQFFTYQILRGLRYIHSAGVIHRDLKPQNLLVNNNCDLKICDFGLAREQDHQMTGYVVTRYYRAPEVMLTWQQYNYAVDIWSVGCILAEMLRGKPLFPGKNHIDQFTIITQVLGNPPQEVVERVYSRNTLKFLESLPPREPHPLSSFFTGAEEEVVDLIEKMLQLDPYKRITATDALSHPYLVNFHDPEDEPEASEEINMSYDEVELSPEEWKKIMYREVLDFHEGSAPSKPGA